MQFMKSGFHFLSHIVLVGYDQSCQIFWNTSDAIQTISNSSSFVVLHFFLRCIETLQSECSLNSRNLNTLSSLCISRILVELLFLTFVKISMTFAIASIFGLCFVRLFDYLLSYLRNTYVIYS